MSPLLFVTLWLSTGALLYSIMFFMWFQTNQVDGFYVSDILSLLFLILGPIAIVLVVPTILTEYGNKISQWADKPLIKFKPKKP